MARMLAAQLARLGRRSGIWLLTAVLVVLNVLVARHNVDGVRTAQANLALCIRILAKHPTPESLDTVSLQDIYG